MLTNLKLKNDVSEQTLVDIRAVNINHSYVRLKQVYVVLCYVVTKLKPKKLRCCVSAQFRVKSEKAAVYDFLH